MTPQSIRYQVTGRIARLTLDRPARANALTFPMIAELAAAVDRANLDPAVHVIALDGAGPGFCAGYDLMETAESRPPDPAAAAAPPPEEPRWPPGSPMDLAVQQANHDPARPWDPMLDYAMMSRNAGAFMTLLESPKPVLCKIHGYCLGGGSDLALCADLIVVAEDARIGYPPARVWGSPTTAMWAYHLGAQRAKRLLLTGDSLTGAEAVAWGLAVDSAPAAELDARFEALVGRVAQMPQNQLVMMKLLVNQTLFAQGLHAARTVGVLLDGMARHSPEGQAFRQRAMEVGFKQAVRERDQPFPEAKEKAKGKPR